MFLFEDGSWNLLNFQTAWDWMSQVLSSPHYLTITFLAAWLPKYDSNKSTSKRQAPLDDQTCYFAFKSHTNQLLPSVWGNTIFNSCAQQQARRLAREPGQWKAQTSWINHEVTGPRWDLGPGDPEVGLAPCLHPIKPTTGQASQRYSR